MLDDAEPIPFPNQEVPFSLPESEFGTLIKQKCKDATIGDESEGKYYVKEKSIAIFHIFLLSCEYYSLFNQLSFPYMYL